MGKTHGLSGIVVGLAVGAALDTSPAVCGVLATATAVGAYVPDIDHPGSTISRSLGPITGLLSWLARGLSKRVYAATKGPRDEDCEGSHRHLLHSVAFSVLLGAAVGAGVLAGTGAQGWALLIGGGLALGCVTHIVGDALTLSGVSGFLWPIPIAGETFYEVRLPRGLRFRTGGVVETYLVAPALLVAAVLLVPGVWPLVAPLAGGLWLAVVG
jgi:membrane-bound metal-dependent hydrolase YbcI (DUF457 family)